MRVAVLDRDLLWSVRLERGLRALGHEPVSSEAEPADAAILNLAEFDANQVEALHARGVVVIGHAGHREKELHALGASAGVDVLATNGELALNLPKVLARAAAAPRP